jgi:hypothetical protein
MLYPVYVHRDLESSHGVTFPDFPGCFSAADELAEILALSPDDDRTQGYLLEAGRSSGIAAKQQEETKSFSASSRKEGATV